MAFMINLYGPDCILHQCLKRKIMFIFVKKKKKKKNQLLQFHIFKKYMRHMSSNFDELQSKNYN